MTSVTVAFIPVIGAVVLLVCIISSVYLKVQKRRKDNPEERDGPILLPTVSVATLDRRSTSYKLLLVAALISTPLFITTGTFQYQTAQEKGPKSTDDGIPVIVLSCLCSSALLLVSVFPLEGSCFWFPFHILWATVFMDCGTLWLLYAGLLACF